MRKNAFSLITTLIIVAIVSSLFIVYQTQQGRLAERTNNPIPYIYYYTPAENAFIIERANGTDSRFLAQGIAPDDHNVIDSVHWSPSGEYLAWRSHRHNGPGAFYVSGFLTSTDGTYISTYFEDATDIFLMEWSPTADWLVVGHQGAYDDLATTIALLDVPNDRVVYEATFRREHYIDPGYYHAMPRVWSDDGTATYFSFSNLEGRTVVRITPDGRAEYQTFASDMPLVSFNRGRLMHAEFSSTENGYAREWFITDWHTGESHTYMTEEHDEYVSLTRMPEQDFNVHWNLQRTHALIRERTCEQTEPYLNDCTDQHVIFDWQTGEKYTLPDNVRMYSGYRYDLHIWSPDGTAMILADNDSEDRILFDVINLEVVDVQPRFQRSNWAWAGDRDIIYEIRRTTDDGIQMDSYIFNWETATTQFIDLPDDLHFSGIADISPDMQLLGLSDRDVRVLDRDTDTIYTGTSHSQTTWAGPIMRYNFHPDNEWFFAGGNTVVAGGGGSSSAITIHHIDDPIGREITLCHGVHTCTGFVPDNVLPFLTDGQEDSIIEPPTHTLIHDMPVLGVTFNADGTKLLSISSQRESIALNIWDMTADTPILEATIEGDYYCSMHPMACPIQWLDDHTVRVPVQDYIDRRTYYFALEFDLQSLSVTANTYGDEFVPHEISTYYIPDDEEQGMRDAPIIHRPTGEQVGFITSDWFSIFPQTPIAVDPQTNLAVLPHVYGRGTIWNIVTGEQIATANWTGYDAALHPDSTQLAVASTRVVTLWDMTPYLDQLAHND